MSQKGARRVLVAVEPVVLEGAFAVILEMIDVDEVVQFHDATESQRRESYDAAIVTTGFPGEVSADVVITLPDTKAETDGSGDSGVGHVTTRHTSDDVDVRHQGIVIDLLDEHLPVAVCRRGRLPSAWQSRV
ncbi:MAG TPA: hypothetical protein VNA57_13265 [Acidimicrobiales bacterium]|nr:hypothetical protein [Acidimicrobiales bacterium]